MNLLNKQLIVNNALNIFYNEKVIKIDGINNNFLIKTNNSIYKSQTVIIASGGGLFRPINLGLKNEKSCKNIIYKITDTKKFIGKKLTILEVEILRLTGLIIFLIRDPKLL